MVEHIYESKRGKEENKRLNTPKIIKWLKRAINLHIGREHIRKSGMAERGKERERKHNKIGNKRIRNA
jgi:hypothetical protein